MALDEQTEWRQEFHDYRVMVCGGCPLQQTVYFGWNNPNYFCGYPGGNATHGGLNVAYHDRPPMWTDPDAACPWPTGGWRPAVFPDIGQAFGGAA